MHNIECNIHSAIYIQCNMRRCSWYEEEEKEGASHCWPPASGQPPTDRWNIFDHGVDSEFLSKLNSIILVSLISWPPPSQLTSDHLPVCEPQRTDKEYRDVDSELLSTLLAPYYGALLITPPGDVPSHPMHTYNTRCYIQSIWVSVFNFSGSTKPTDHLPIWGAKQRTAAGQIKNGTRLHYIWSSCWFSINSWVPISQLCLIMLFCSHSQDNWNTKVVNPFSLFLRKE